MKRILLFAMTMTFMKADTIIVNQMDLVMRIAKWIYKVASQDSIGHPVYIEGLTIDKPIFLIGLCRYRHDLF